MTKKLFIRTELLYDGPGSNSLMAKFPTDQPYSVDGNTRIHFEVRDHRLHIKIVCYMAHDISEKRFSAFEEVLAEKQPINLLAAGNGKVKSFIDENIDKWSPCKRIFGLLRWSYKSSLFDNFVKQEFFWSLDNSTWHQFQTVNITPAQHTWILFRPNQKKFNGDATNLDLIEPDYFSLLREAESHLTDNPKSALIVMVVALEIAMKRFLSFKNPSLLDDFNGETPPSIEKIFSEYLFATEKSLVFNEKSSKILKKLIKNRNELVHQGLFTLSKESLIERFRFVSDILYILDYYRGIPWFNQSFYEYEQRLQSDHKVFYENDDDSIGLVVPGSVQTITFESR